MNLFRKKIQPACGYCAFAREGEDDSLVCFYSGPTTPDQSCKRFRYDPLQRDPNGWGNRPSAPPAGDGKSEEAPETESTAAEDASTASADEPMSEPASEEGEKRED